MAAANWTLSDDRKTATISFPTSPPVTLNVSAALLDDMLMTLGDLRWEMQPEVSETFEHVEASVPDPAYELEPDESNQNIILHFRDPRFGWLHFSIPREEARKLTGYLRELL